MLIIFFHYTSIAIRKQKVIIRGFFDLLDLSENHEMKIQRVQMLNYYGI